MSKALIAITAVLAAMITTVAWAQNPYPTPSPTLTAAGTPTATTSPAATPTPATVDLVAIVKQFLGDENTGDFPAALALLTDDAVINGGSCQPPCVGKAAILKDMQQGQATHTQHVLADSTFQVSGNIVTGRIEHQSDLSRAAGINRFFVIATIEFTGDKISHITPRLDISDPQTATFAAFQKARQLANTGSGPASGGGAGFDHWLVEALAGLGALLTASALWARRRRAD
jgi:hypothetical protein